MSDKPAPTIVGRYVLYAPIARGGMATIHLARLLGAEGFSRMVAAKRLHRELLEETELVEMLLDEARIASKIHHPNVVPVLDVVRSGGEVVLVEEYVHGVPLDKLLRAAQTGERLPPAVVIAIAADMLAGLGAAHEAKDELGVSLGIVHRDVSPQNVLVGVDGIARLLDFGVAKAALNGHVTRAGMFKGKLAYSSPEQLRGVVTVATDIWAAAVVIWEALSGKRMYPGLHDADLVAAVARGQVTRLTDAVAWESVPPETWDLFERVEPVLAKALAYAPDERWASAAEMREELLAAASPATTTEVSRWVKALGKEFLEGREKLIVTEESSWRQRGSAVPIDDPSARALARAGALPATLRPSVSAIPEIPPPPRQSPAVVVALAVIGVLLVGILAILLRRPDPAPPVVVAAPGVASEPPPPLRVEPAPPPPIATATASASAAPSPLASTAPHAPHVSPRVPLPPAPAAIAPRAAATPVAPAAPAAPARNCNPPFYFEGKKKVFKPGCL